MRWFSAVSMILILLVAGCSKKNAKTNPGNTPEELLTYADRAFNSGDYESAFLAYGLIYDQHPTSREYIDAAIGMSRCYGEFEDYERSFEMLHNLLKENLIPSKVPQIYNVIGDFYERSAGISEQLTGQGYTDYKTAIGYYKKAIDYPNSEDQKAKSYSQYKIGSLYIKIAEYDSALQALQKTVDDYPTQQWASLAQEKTGLLQTLIENQKTKQMYDAATAKKDTLMSSPQMEKATAPVKTDTLKTAAPPDTTKTVKPPEPEPVPPDTTNEKKPKLDLN
jgi:tetratricopeptide (TPR) repeat protein